MNILKKIITNNYIISLLIISLTFIWFKLNTPEKVENTSLLNSIENEIKPFNVKTKKIEINDFHYTKNFIGTTKAHEIYPLYTREEGVVNNLKIKEGVFVNKNDILFKIESDKLFSELDFVKNSLKEKERLYQNNKKLFEKGYTTEDMLIKSESDFKKALSDLDDINDKIEKTIIKSNNSGYIYELDLENGFFLQKNTKILEIHDLSTIKIDLYIPEIYINDIYIGQEATVYINNNTYNGSVSFVSKIADRETHTFKVEVLISNKEYKINSGLSSSVEIKFKPVKGIKISPYILTMDREKIGIKIVNENKKVDFLPIEIVKTFKDNDILIKGDFPDYIELIILGQEYVKINDIVNNKESDSNDILNADI